tara:strand:+ start:724 stop:1794 length:1071 start_codon:yes stop_codon:yes gene_type:complete
MKKILIICPYPYGVQAGQRLKFEPHFDLLDKNKYEIKISSFINKKMWKIIYEKGHLFEKILFTFYGYLRRIKEIFFLYKYDTVYIFLWVTPFGGSIFESIYRFFSKKIIYDIEDNILYNQPENKVNFNLRSINKIKYLIKKSDKIICSSPDLKKKCNLISKKNNCFYIPPSLNLNKYVLKQKNLKKKITIGWTGTFSSKKYLDIVLPVLKKLSKIREFEFTIISNFEFKSNDLKIKFIRWNKASEINDLNNFDIGIYPLINDDWIIGKSGLKALQYMALGIPSISSNFGNVINFIQNNKNGILVSDQKEWYNALLYLIDNPDIRKKIGLNGRKTIERNFSFNEIHNLYLKVLEISE